MPFYITTALLRASKNRALVLPSKKLVAAARALVRRTQSDRLIGFGEFRGETSVAVVLEPLGSEAISVISMRPASRKERSLL
jgi:uncharacterized DUF497 family protein